MSGKFAASSRPKTEPKFQHVRDITNALQDQNEANLTKSLISLRNQLTVQYEERVSINDERLLLLKSWLESVPAARDVFSIWENLNSKQQALQSAVVSLLAATLTVLSSHYSFHPLAAPIVNALLSSRWFTKLNGYLSSTHRDLVLFTLKLFNCLLLYGGGQERKTILEGFAWESKVLSKLLNMRRRGGEAKNILAVPDIRSLFILILLSFVDVSTPPSVKATFLEQRREIFTNLFKGLTDDPYPLARRVLETCWSGIWSDHKIKRTLKVAVFQESTISHITKLYERSTPEGSDSDDVPADLVHHFLLAICTTPGVGICFKDRGWYPRDTGHTGFEGSNKKASGNLYNRILGNMLNGLKVNEDSRQQELALRVLKACPELVAGYWTASSLTLEPRLSSKWMANVALLGSVISQPVPTAMFKLPDAQQDLYNPTPPGLTVIVENILPTANIKTHFSRGLQSATALVQHCTALALTKCLTKYQAILDEFKAVESALNEGDTGRWSMRRMEVEREIRRRVPDLQVVLAFAQQKGHNVLQGQPNNDKPQQANLARNALLLECAQRLLWLYHKLLPNLVSEARFDVGRLLQTTYAAESAKSSEAMAGVDTLRHLHVLRLLRVSDQFTWSAKTGTHSNFGVLLKFYIGARSFAIQSAIEFLLRDVLSASLLFQHDADELSLWLQALRDDFTQPTQEDEVNTVASFLDDCAQRYAKTPYRYIEEQRHLLRTADDKEPSVADHPESSPSPLLMVVIEQVCAKLNSQKDVESSIHPVVRFLRRLFLCLASKVPALTILYPAVHHLEAGLKLEASESSATTAVPFIKQEVQCLADDLAVIEGSSNTAEVSVEAFVERVASGDLRSSTFLTMLLQTNDAVFTNEESRRLLTKAVGRSLPDFRRSLALVNHRLLSCVSQRHRARGDLLLLASSLAEKAKTVLGHEQMRALRDSVFQLPSIKHIASVDLEEHSRIGLASVLRQFLQEDGEQGRTAVAEHVSFWLQRAIANGLQGDQGATALLWLQYLSFGQLWTFVDFICSGNLPSEFSLLTKVLDVLLVSVPEALRQPDEASQFHRLELLVRLQSILPESSALEPMISLALRNLLPQIYPSSLNQSTSPTTSLTTALASRRKQNYHRHRGSHNQIDIAQFLSTGSWTTHTKEIVVNLLYLQPAVRTQVLGWVQKNVGTCTVEHLSGILLALVDSASHPEIFVSEDGEYLLTACRRFVRALSERNCSSKVLDTIAACICRLVQDLGSIRQSLLAMFLDECRSFKRGALSVGVLEITSTLLGCCGKEADRLVEVVLGHVFSWVTDIFSRGDIGFDTYRTLQVTATLIRNSSNVKSHLVEPFITVAIQNLLSEAKVLDFTREVIRVASLKPAGVNKLLQAVVQHPKLYELCGSSNHNLEVRISVINLLHTLFHLHPTNTCQPSHIIPLVPLYGGTLSAFDRKLLAILHLYEATRKTSAASYLLTRGSPDSAQALSAIQLLDPDVVFRTCANFPQWRKLDAEVVEPRTAIDGALYDPVYVMLLFAQLLSDQVPTSALVWVQVFRTNIVSLLFRALSSDDGAMREVALAQITGLYKCLKDTDMVEKPHVIHILNLLKDSYRSSPSQPHPDGLPTYTTLHLAHSLRGIFYPSQFTYPMTARYLLQRPELDITDVPMLYTTLYSADDQWKRDRAWIVRFLGDGMVGKAEWKVLKRRHTWDLVASQFQGTADRAFRHGALRLLASITSKPFTITQLVLKSSLLTWMELQLEDLKLGEELAWLSIIENVVVLADIGKLDAATNGEWYLTLGRCITTIVNRASTSLDTLFRALQIILRLSLLRPQNPQLPNLISSCTKHLESLEPLLPDGPITKPSTSPSYPPHTGQDLFRISNDDASATWWYGQCVETLWRAAMNLPRPPESWADLTEELLVWRAYAGAEVSALGEWVRKEVVQNLAS